MFIYPKVKALDRPEVKSFVDFYLTRDRRWCARSATFRLDAKEQDLVAAAFAARKTGTMFSGTDSHSQVTLEQRLAR